MALPPTSVTKDATAEQATDALLPLSACVSLLDLEKVAHARFSPRATAYYLSGAESQSSQFRNRSDWSRIGFRPRVLRNVTDVKLRTRIMGAECSLPVFISPTAFARLGHPDGELCLARGAARMGIAQCVSSYASVSPRKVIKAFRNDPARRQDETPGGIFFQLYLPRARGEAEALIRSARDAGFQGLVVTVDTAVTGKRDIDDRFKAMQFLENGGDTTEAPKFLLPGKENGVLRAHGTIVSWADLPWIRELWGRQGPIVLKGIQSPEDALEATRHADVVDAIYLSNHGGRQLDYAPTSVRTLLAIRETCPEVFDKIDVYVDGGVLRGTDIVKALCLGARGVGIGRGFIYALSSYGTDGVMKAIQILSDEIQTTMRLLGVTDVAELNPSYVDLSDFNLQRAKL